MAERIVNGVRFRSIPGWPRHEAGEDGSILSWCKTGGHKFGGLSDAPRVLKQWTSRGYKFVCMAKHGTYHSKPVYRLVLEAFMGPPKPGQEACHNNGVRGDSRLENLRWDTRSGNHADKKRHGTWQGGERHGGAKLLEESVVKIKTELAYGNKTLDQIAEEYGVKKPTIARIRARRTWWHVLPEVNETLAAKRGIRNGMFGGARQAMESREVN